MDNKVRYIIEDLLPLYNEGLLSEETTKWFEEQINGSEEYKQLVLASQSPLPKPAIPSPVDHERMLQRIKRKLAVYQLIFVAISFFLAINTSLLNESFGFILWYAVLGAVTYGFYKDMRMVALISIVPVFVWSLGSSIADYRSGDMTPDLGLGEFMINSAAGALLLSGLHYVFALVGSLIGLLIVKLREKG